MKLRNLLAHLRDQDENCTVRVSLNGERPLDVRAVAFSDDDTIVLLAVPSWSLSELDHVMALLPSRKTWLEVFQPATQAGTSHQFWACIEHSLPYEKCEACRDIVATGFHFGVQAPTKRFCNCHSKAQCPDGLKDDGSSG
jgi:hypothetical protein